MSTYETMTKDVPMDTPRSILTALLSIKIDLQDKYSECPLCDYEMMYHASYCPLYNLGDLITRISKDMSHA